MPILTGPAEVDPVLDPVLEPLLDPQAASSALTAAAAATVSTRRFVLMALPSCVHCVGWVVVIRSQAPGPATRIRAGTRDPPASAAGASRRTPARAARDTGRRRS